MINIIQGHKLKSMIFVITTCSYWSVASQEVVLKKIMNEIEQEKKEKARLTKRIEKEVRLIVDLIKKEVKEEFEEERKRKKVEQLAKNEQLQIQIVAQKSQAEESARIEARSITTQDRQFIREWIQKRTKKK
ncbi:MAG: hypothetical protein NTZ68_03550 [Candidatus Dependentiae bacterium]|nr:hypothetical protein [Candidatus Dependentiae bacterium]